ncbi:MAG: zinc metallopeptidase [Desulfobacterales bacterium]|nr:zinc metallopeptidase [Desulfobacterales bacterium]MDJ0915839.1 zinc metallopeptidase [Desulfobacterales bacterium]
MVYILIIIAVVAVIYGPHLWAKHVINRYNQKEYFSGNGLELARLVLNEKNLNAVSVEKTAVGDHYNPLTKVVGLTDARCGKRTLTAVVVAAHEVGHAIQDQANYRPLHTRTRLVVSAAKFERIGALLIMAVPVLAAITRVPATGFLLFLGGLATLCIPLVVHLLTLPVEFDASFNRALPLLVSGNYIPKEDLPAAKKILWACALTYVANALVGLLNVWRWIRILRR